MREVENREEWRKVNGFVRIMDPKDGNGPHGLGCTTQWEEAAHLRMRFASL